MTAITDTKWTDTELSDLLITAMEGGIGYWALIARYEYAPGRTAADYREVPGAHDPDWLPPYARLPLEGGSVVLADAETEEEFPRPLDRAALLHGLALLAERYPRRWASVREGMYDIEDADAAIQLAVFGELVYG